MSMSNEYNAKSQVQQNVASHLESAIERSLASMDAGDAAATFTVLELGCGPGNNSAALWRTIVKSVCAKSSTRPILVFAEDLTGNNWASVFETALREDQANVFFAGVGRSFYDRLLPSKSVDFILSSTALHWLPAAEFPRPNRILCEDHAPPAIRREITDYARRMWHTMFTHRAEELKPQHYFVFAMPQHWPERGQTNFVLFRQRTFPFDRVPAELHDRLCAPMHWLDADTFEQFFGADTGHPNNLTHLFKLCSVTIHRTDCPYMAKYEVDKDVNALASSIIDSSLVVYGPFLRSVLKQKLSDDAITDIFATWRREFIGMVTADALVEFVLSSYIVTLQRK